MVLTKFIVLSKDRTALKILQNLNNLATVTVSANNSYSSMVTKIQLIEEGESEKRKRFVVITLIMSQLFKHPW